MACTQIKKLDDDLHANNEGASCRKSVEHVKNEEFLVEYFHLVVANMMS